LVGIDDPDITEKVDRFEPIEFNNFATVINRKKRALR